MANVIWTRLGDTFTFSKGRVYPLDDPAGVNVPVDYSAGGKLYAYDKGIKEKFFNLEYDGLSQTDYDHVENWLLNVVIGPRRTFIYTDESGVQYTVRWLDTRNPLRRTRDGMYAGTLSLRKEI